MGNFIAFGLANGAPIGIISILNISIFIGIRKTRLKDSKTSNTDSRYVRNLMLKSLSYEIFVTPMVIMYNLYIITLKPGTMPK